MKLRFITIAFALIVCSFSSSAFAGWLYASSFQYFNASGQVVGQSLISCSTSTPRKFSGVTSTYWRQDSILCSDLIGISGTKCTFVSGAYPSGSWSCVPMYVVYEQGGKVINDINKLPPGLNLLASCQKVGCDVRATQFIPALASGAVVDGNNFSVPSSATDPVE